MPLETPFRELPKTVAEWNRFFRSQVVIPDKDKVTETTIADGSVTPAKLSEAYYTESELDAGQLDTRYYTESELDGGQLDSRYYTETEIDSLSATGSFTGTLTGLITSPTGTVNYDRSNNLVTLNVAQINGTSNDTVMTMTGLPSAIYPTAVQRMPFIVQDNGVIQLGLIEINTLGVVTFYNSVSLGVFTNTGTKGVEQQSITYSIG